MEDSLDAVRRPHADTATARPGGRTARVAEAVLDATLAELAEVGYAALRVEAVAEHLGRTSQVWSATVFDSNGRKLSLFRCSQIILW